MGVRLEYFRADGLFGQYSNEIALKLNDRVTGVIGPNGRGKTVCLRLIDALYRRNFWYLTTIEFERLTYRFTNGVELQISRLDPDEEVDLDEGRFRRIPVVFNIKQGGELQTPWHPKQKAVRGQSSAISKHIPWLIRIGPNIWSDERTGERLLTDAILTRYADVLPFGALDDVDSDEPQIVTETLQGVQCHLIETQRLLSFSEEGRAAPYERGRRLEPGLVIQQKARLLRQHLQRQLAEYGILSQRLDRSFPRRVIESRFSLEPTLADISLNLKRLEERRKDLEKAGILDTEFEPLFAIPDNIDSTIGRMLSVYVEDTEKKLNHFADLLAKINLFRNIIDDRFIAKSVKVDKVEGFRVIAEKSGKEIPLDKMSSGEQHQLILVFELLFELKPNTLVMIDEPELSLHVSWQKKFIGDLKRIIDLNEVDVLLATHSPQLIGRWSELSVELAAVDG